ncbi:hypothetical protein M426DRAFT_324311 [Hypoxylon sp. CI-4A]|nr:hypothetical protein M426DRAFT_324311 [Hypoxylon sp. CI-4A]
MRSYCHLVTTPLDLAQAKTLNLIDARVKWIHWHRWRSAVLAFIGSDDDDDMVHRRYHYGELRVSRLNWIWRFQLRGLAYFTQHREYTTYFGQYFRIFIVVFAFATTLLQGMQTALAVPHGSATTFERVAYVVAVVAIVSVLASICFTAVLFLPLFFYNSFVTLVRQCKEVEKKRDGKVRGKTSVPLA